MSKYHPLDVRHPDNRARERKSFLLEAADDSAYSLKPLRDLRPAPARRSGTTTAAPIVAQSVETAPEKSAPATPWGQSAPSSPPPPTPAQPRRGGFPWKLIYLVIIAFVVLKNTELGADIARFVTQTLNDLGR